MAAAVFCGWKYDSAEKGVGPIGLLKAIGVRMNSSTDQKDEWLPVVGRSLAFLCLAQADLRDKDLATQGKFLESLGLSRKDAAALLGTSYASLTELIRLASKKKGGNRARTKKRP